MYAVAALEKALVINQHVWRSPLIEQPAKKLAAEVRAGIEAHGVVPVEGSPEVRMYAYEVDGLGGALKDFDDPNVPSLLSIPLLGYSHYEREVYAVTRRRILSSANHYFYRSKNGTLAGLGSPHAPHGFLWPLGLMVQVRPAALLPGLALLAANLAASSRQAGAWPAGASGHWRAAAAAPASHHLCLRGVLQALTTTNTVEQAATLRWLLKMQCSNGLMHESVYVENLSSCTRPIFEWANAMLVALVETLLGTDCDAEAQALHLRAIRARERAVQQGWLGNHGGAAAGSRQLDVPEVPAGEALYYERMEQTINYANSYDAAAAMGQQSDGKSAALR
jgi:hypothetical protein